MKQLLLILLAFGFSFCSKPAETKVIAKGSVKFAIGDVSIVTKEICERINIGGWFDSAHQPAISSVTERSRSAAITNYAMNNISA
ncbi:MAG: hypothetical protein KBF99_19725 [Leptospiraceae bacterium]|jgi:hypothetical protein|nr:hypothetical protein [Leptospiraceae bacterium]